MADSPNTTVYPHPWSAWFNHGRYSSDTRDRTELDRVAAQQQRCCVCDNLQPPAVLKLGYTLFMLWVLAMKWLIAS